MAGGGEASVDRWLHELETALDVQELSHVKSERREYNMITKMESIRDHMDALLRDGEGREELVRVFGGDCSRVARYRTVCDNAKLSQRADARVAACLKSCEAVESIVKELGLASRLAAAQAAAKAAREASLAVPEEPEDEAGPEETALGDIVAPIANVAVAGSEAIALEEAGDIPRALEKYEECRASVLTAITVTKAVQKFRASLHSSEEAQARIQRDLEELEAHKEQIQKRMDYLNFLDTDEKPALAAHEQIKAPDLSVNGEKGKRKKVLASCAAIGAGAGIVLLGPFSAMLAVGGAVAAGAAAATVAARDDALGERVYKTGEAGLGLAKVGVHKAADAMDKAASAAQKASGKARQSADDFF